MQDFYEPKVGDMASDFRLPSIPGGETSLNQFKKKTIVLYFYPKDDTPGCTAEACSFRDRNKEIEKEGAVILGVSIDAMDRHEKFREKHNLNFRLLSDQSADVAKMYGAWKEKNMYGRRYWGVARMTYIIGPDRRIRKIYKKVDTKTHGDDVLAELRRKSEG